MVNKINISMVRYDGNRKDENFAIISAKIEGGFLIR